MVVFEKLIFRVELLVFDQKWIDVLASSHTPDFDVSIEECALVLLVAQDMLFQDRKGAFRKPVIRIKLNQKRRINHCQSLVHHFGDARVLFHPVILNVWIEQIAFYLMSCFVCRRIIHDQQLPVLARLLHDTGNCFANVFGAIVCGNHYGKQRSWIGHSLSPPVEGSWMEDLSLKINILAFRSLLPLKKDSRPKTLSFICHDTS